MTLNKLCRTESTHLEQLRHKNNINNKSDLKDQHQFVRILFSRSSISFRSRLKWLNVYLMFSVSLGLHTIAVCVFLASRNRGRYFLAAYKMSTVQLSIDVYWYGCKSKKIWVGRSQVWNSDASMDFLLWNLRWNEPFLLWFANSKWDVWDVDCTFDLHVRDMTWAH